MNQTQRIRRPGRKRWTDLVRFLTTQMKAAASEKVRMAAAMRLADILTLREEREQLELKREMRLASKADENSAEKVTEEREESVEEFLARVTKERGSAAITLGDEN